MGYLTKGAAITSQANAATLAIALDFPAFFLLVMQFAFPITFEAQISFLVQHYNFPQEFFNCNPDRPTDRPTDDSYFYRVPVFPTEMQPKTESNMPAGSFPFHVGGGGEEGDDASQRSPTQAHSSTHPYPDFINHERGGSPSALFVDDARERTYERTSERTAARWGTSAQICANPVVLRIF